MLLNTRLPQQIQYLNHSVYPLMKVYICKLVLRIHRRMIYPLKTRPGSTDIAGIENVSKANWARTGNYCIFPFHNFIASKDSFAYGESSIDNGTSRYLVNSSCTCLVTLNRHLWRDIWRCRGRGRRRGNFPFITRSNWLWHNISQSVYSPSADYQPNLRW